jgi:hypothetical protein
MRRDVWRQGIRGGAAGALAALVGYAIAVRTPYVTSRVKLESKHRFAAPLFGMALGMVLGASTAARNNMHTVHFILHKQKSVPRNATVYQEKVASAREAREELEWNVPSYARTGAAAAIGAGAGAKVAGVGATLGAALGAATGVVPGEVPGAAPGAAVAVARQLSRKQGAKAALASSLQTSFQDPLAQWADAIAAEKKG